MVSYTNNGTTTTAATTHKQKYSIYITQLQKIEKRSDKYNTLMYVLQTITNNASDDLCDVLKLHM